MQKRRKRVQQDEVQKTVQKVFKSKVITPKLMERSVRSAIKFQDGILSLLGEIEQRLNQIEYTQRLLLGDEAKNMVGELRSRIDVLETRLNKWGEGAL